MNTLQVGNIVLKAAYSTIVIFAVDDTGAMKFGTFHNLGKVVNGDTGEATLQMLSDFYDVTAPEVGGLEALGEVINMARCFCEPKSYQAMAA